MGNTVQRRFVELNVGEVSLVDSPANEEEFAVIKSLNAQEETMAEEIKTEKADDATEEAAEETTEEEVEKVEVEVPATEDDAVQKAMDKVAATVEAIAKSAGIEVPEEGATEEDAEKAKKELPSGTQFGASGIRELFMKSLKAAGVKGDALKQAMTSFDEKAKAAPPWLKPGKGDKDDKAKKTEKADDVVPTEKAAEESVLEQLSIAIEKAKRFTPKRADALKGAIEALTKLQGELEEVKPDKAQLPGNAQFGESGIKEITKAITELTGVFKEQMTEVADTTKALGDRVEAIETERQPSSSVDDDGGTDTEVKKEQGLWTGLL